MQDFTYSAMTVYSKIKATNSTITAETVFSGAVVKGTVCYFCCLSIKTSKTKD